jgi:hypothetical protein
MQFLGRDAAVTISAGMLQESDQRHAGSPCIICGYDLRSDPAGHCPECGSTRSQRDSTRAEQGEAAHRQSQFLLLALGWMVILAMGLSVLVGLLQAAMFG